MRVLFVGDVFGQPGRRVLQAHLPLIRSRFDFVIVNVENAAGGFGLHREGAVAALQARRDGVVDSIDGARIVVERAGGRSIAQTILDVAEVEKASMIVMTTHGRSGLGRVLLGSVAEAVVHAAPIPVLLVKGEQPVAAWSR